MHYIPRFTLLTIKLPFLAFRRPHHTVHVLLKRQDDTKINIASDLRYIFEQSGSYTHSTLSVVSDDVLWLSCHEVALCKSLGSF